MRRSLFNSPRNGSRDPRRRFSKRTAGAAFAGGVASLATVGAIVASAAVPTFPDNVVVFPDRDFVTIEGYQDHIGETATVSVTRGGTVMGSAVGTVAEGDVAFEINHPGGYCWGAGGGPAVTPDIQKGDKVSIKFADGTTGDTTVSTGTATTHAALNGSTVTVTVLVALSSAACLVAVPVLTVVSPFVPSPNRMETLSPFWMSGVTAGPPPAPQQ
jgi:hypothetical protein